MKDEYIRNGIVREVIDGDTIVVDIDLGDSIWITRRVRINGVDAPEIHTTNLLEKSAGLKVKEYLNNLLLNKAIVLQTFKDENDKYGRYLAKIEINGLDLTQELINIGYARSYGGEKKVAWSEDQLKKINGDTNVKNN